MPSSSLPWDYLLKPIDKGELAAAVVKAADRAVAAVQPMPAGKLCFKSANGRIIVAADDIAFIKAEGNYAHITTFHSHDLVTESLLSLEQRLPAEMFVRVDRSTIVNFTKIYRLNNQQRTCTFLSPDGQTLQLKLTKSGMEQLLMQLG